jgi:hypothetical protein
MARNLSADLAADRAQVLLEMFPVSRETTERHGSTALPRCC